MKTAWAAFSGWRLLWQGQRKVSGVKISAISLPAAGSLLLLFVVGALAAELSYRIVTKATLTERVKWEE